MIALATPARATDTWTDAFVGVKRLHRKTSDQKVNALVVDLCAPGISLRATGEAEKGQKTSAFATQVGAQAAVNGDFYGPGYVPNGMAMTGGGAWGATDQGYVGPIAFGEQRAEIVAHEAVAGPEPWMREVVSGHPTILWGGAQRDNNGDPLCSARHPRTAAGLSADKKTLVLAVVDGRKPDRIGMTCDELSALLKELGAHDGVNLDGGGSSTLWLGGQVVNHPSDGTERTVANHLAVHAAGSGPAVSCPVPAYRAEFVSAGGFPGGTQMTLEAGDVVSGFLELENTGSATWTPGITKLGTSEPRDRESALATASWLGPNRAATVTESVPPGSVGRFEIELAAPLEPGVYLEHFNLVEEAVSWFSDSGGPADDVLWLEVTSVEPGRGSGGGWSSGGAAGAAGGGGSGTQQSSRVLDDEGGCACRSTRSRGTPITALWLAALAWLAARRLSGRFEFARSRLARASSGP